MECQKIEHELLQRGCKWVFQQPMASSVSRIWEQMVRSAKTALKAILGSQTVTDTVLQMLLTEVERMLNGRALTANSDDPKDLQPLTPAHFLMQRHTICLPPDNSPRGCRNLGWVLETYAGPDGLVRVVKVKTKDAVYMRPTQKLCLLENDMN